MIFNVESLLKGNIPNKFNDKIFWYATKVEINKKEINIFIDNDKLFTFDNIDINIKKISELVNIKQDSNQKLNNVLISSGSFLFINEKLAVTQRELTTKFDPGFWTTPAGRCDRTILDTALKETIEEIEIIQNNKILYPKIAQNFVNKTKDVIFYDASFSNSKIPINTTKVKLFLDNNLVQECYSWFYFSKEVNTIEFRIPIFTTLNEQSLQFRNPEFGTPTGLKTIEELKTLQCVPALKKLIEEITNGK